MTINGEGHAVRIRHGQQVMAAGDLLGALAATNAGDPFAPKS